MASSNEMIVDALVRRQIGVQRYSKSLVAEIVDLLDSTEPDIAKQIEKRIAKIAERGFDTGPDTTSRLKVLRETLKEIRAGAFGEITDISNSGLRQLAKDEATYLGQVYQEHAPVDLDLLTPHLGTLGKIVATSPFEGNLMKDWASKLARDDLDRMMTAIRLGLVEGEGIGDIMRRVLGTVGNDGADGVLELTRQNAEAIARTAVSTVVNDARQDFFEENSDVFEEELYVATLDGRTTAQCRALDGKKFKIGEGPIPPVHWNCRSTRVALINGKAIGKRPAVGATEEMLDGLSPKERQKKVRELTGQVDASTTYQDFLKRQTVGFQEDVLGVSKAKLFRDGGVSLDKFVNRKGDELTLDQLRKAEPSAFKRAGLWED